MKKKLFLMISIFFICLNHINAKEVVKFSRCVDGDTFKAIINDEEKTIRLIAIDAPESVKPDTEVAYYGKEASEYTCNKLTKAKKIELEYDENSDKQDKYDRIIAWVFIDNKLLQLELVKNGYAKVAYLYNDYKYTEELKKAGELASAKNLGIWNEEAKSKFENKKETKEEDIEYTIKDIIILAILFLTVIFASNKIIKLKKK